MQYVELGFEADLQHDVAALPPFVGVTLRGALGYVLKQTVCQVAHGDCGRCLLQSACPYPTVFDGLPPPDRGIMRKYQKVPQPFVLLVPSGAEATRGTTRLRWGVRLFGSAVRYWPYVAHTFHTIGERGLGRRRVRYRLAHVTDGMRGPPLWTAGTTSWNEPTLMAVSAGTPAGPCTLRWRFATPLRIAAQRAAPASGLSALDLVLAGRRRFKIMDHFYGDPAEAPASSEDHLEAAAFQTVQSNLRSWGFCRFSGRQRRKMKLCGLLGEIAIAGPWHQAGRWLAAIPAIHLGKATSFGFGQVTWEIV